MQGFPDGRMLGFPDGCKLGFPSFPGGRGLSDDGSNVGLSDG